MERAWSISAGERHWTWIPLLVVSDPTKRCIDTASAIKNLAEKLQINVRQIYLVVNKVTEDEDVQSVLPELVKNSGLELVGIVPEDENIRAYDLVGKPIVDLPEDSKAAVAVKGIFEKVCES